MLKLKKCKCFTERAQGAKVFWHLTWCKLEILEIITNFAEQAGSIIKLHPCLFQQNQMQVDRKSISMTYVTPDYPGAVCQPPMTDFTLKVGGKHEKGQGEDHPRTRKRVI